MAKKITSAAAIRNRVKELRMVPATELRANPRNWRRHPKFQRDVLGDVLAEIGFAGAVLARETDAGLEIIDGHLRAEVAKDGKIPVLVLDVDEAEANKLLATFDPIGGLAIEDNLILGNLLKDLTFEGEAAQKLISSLSEEATFPLSEDDKGGVGLNKQNQVIKVAIFFPDLSIFEQALMATGELSREKALVKICEAYLGQGR